MDFTAKPWPDPADCTDVHLGLIPLDPAGNNDRIDPRHINHAIDSLQNVGVFTEGDSWVEWGEPRKYEPDYNQDGRMYGAPGLHVAVRFPPLKPLLPPTAMRPKEYHIWSRNRHLAGLAKAVIEEEFEDLLYNGVYRISDYCCITDATDWSQKPTWDDAGADTDKVVTFYA